MKRILLAAATAVVMASPALADTNVGVTMALFDDNFLTKIREAIKAEADQTPGVHVQFEDAQADIGRQINQVQNFIAQKVDAIIVNPADTAATKKITQMATEAGIPLVYVNRGPDQKQLPPKVSVVVSDHVVAGRMEMDELAKCMKGKGNAAVMLGELASNATQERTQGNKEVIAKYPDIKVVQEQTANYQRNQAIDLMNNWLASGTQIDAVVANTDEWRPAPSSPCSRPASTPRRSAWAASTPRPTPWPRCRRARSTRPCSRTRRARGAGPSMRR